MKHLYRILFCILLGGVSPYIYAQEPTIVYQDGVAWQTTTIDDIHVAIAHNVLKNDYGKCHQFHIAICNFSNQPIEFLPNEAFHVDCVHKGQEFALDVWQADEYIKKVKRSQNWTAAMLGFSYGFSAGMSGYSSYSATGYSPTTGPIYISGQTYNAGASAANTMIASQQLANMGKTMKEERKILQLGYLKRNTILPGQCVSGFLLTKFKKGENIRSLVVVDNKFFRYQWILRKKNASEPLIENK